MGGMAWELREDRCTRRGDMREAVAAAFAGELVVALREACLPVSLDSEAGQLLVVTYEYDSERAPRPIQRLRRSS